MPSLKDLRDDPRVLVRREGDPDPEGRCVVYWMQRAQRGVDNPALNTAILAANELDLPVAVHFGLHPGYPNANRRHYRFLAEGLPETAHRVEARGAHFVLRLFPDHDLIAFCEEVRPALVVGDENPLREPAGWRDSAARRLKVPFWTVDADVVVPTRLFEKEEYAARTLRPKIHKHLGEFLVAPGNPKARKSWRGRRKASSLEIGKRTPPEEILDRLSSVDGNADPVSRFRGGTSEARRLLRRFVTKRLEAYHEDRNEPGLAGTSELSAYLHFGQIGPHTVALAVKDADAPEEARKAFLEELIVRRELAINYVARNPRYDRLAGSHEWARKSLAKHSRDKREHTYNAGRFENAETHDDLWNAAQTEMRVSGRMHGYLRMYWAKKILEWSADPEEAFDTAVRLNDRYELDGRDPNGYAGVAWAIGGKHDRPWGPERKIFGLIRYMNRNGMNRKTDVKGYLERVEAMKAAGR